MFIDCEFTDYYRNLFVFILIIYNNNDNNYRIIIMTITTTTMTTTMMMIIIFITRFNVDLSKKRKKGKRIALR